MTEAEIRSLEFISVSPAGFDCYYCAETDRTFKIKHRKVVVYFGRRGGLPQKSKFPASFNQHSEGLLP